METEVIVEYFEGESPSFEMSSHQNGHLYWYASDLMKMLGYGDYSASMKPIQKAMQVCLSTNIDTYENFIEERRDINGKNVKDFRITRFACYLITMNADIKKETVARAQTYFAALTSTIQEYISCQEDIERVSLRSEVSEHEKSLTSAAKNAGIENYAFFQNKGYMGLYNMSLKNLKVLKNIPSKKTPFDFMGAEELGANIFRITQTEAKIKREKTYGQRELENAAYQVGSEVRRAIKNLDGTMPEEIPPQDDISKIKKDLKKTNRLFLKNDELTDSKS